jgi:hypothetical protein
MPGLEDAIDDLVALDALRKEIAELRGQAIDFLLGEAQEKSRIAAPKDVIGPATAVAAIQLAVKQRLREPPDREIEELIHELRNLSLRRLLRSDPRGDPHGGKVPLLVAARTLRALALTPGEALSRPALCCYYRIARELYTPTAPHFMTGGVRAGERGMATAFQTGECVVAVLAVTHVLESTAEVFEAIERWISAVRVVENEAVPQGWREQELTRLQRVLGCELASRGRELGFAGEALGILKKHATKDAEILLRERIAGHIAQIEKQFVAAIAECKKERKSEVTPPKVTEYSRLRAGESENPPSRRMTSDQMEAMRRSIPLRTERSASAHYQALRALQDGKRVAENVVKALHGANWRAAAVELRNEIARVHHVLRPARHFLKSVLARELAEASSDDLHHSCDYPELAFAASAYGLLRYGRRRLDDPKTTWDHVHLRMAAKVLAARLGTHGLFPVGRPLTVDSWGNRLEVVGAEVTCAMSELLRNVDGCLEPEVVRKMLRLFADTRDPATGGWGFEQVPPPVGAEYWTSALCATALHSMMAMVDENIRTTVLKHFSVRWPKKLTLDSVFYGDYGLATDDRLSLALRFQSMREHVTGVGSPPKQRVHSIVLHGPPGTGKTTLPEALAASTRAPLVEITPSDLISAGANFVERRARIVFQALAMLSDAVILFDEFDSLLRRRIPGAKLETVFEFLTPGMLPKLKHLHEQAEERRTAYVLATNMVGDLDEAAIRDGRFDARVAVFSPDLLSRVGRLIFELCRSGFTNLDEKVLDRIAVVVAVTAGGGMTVIGRRGWFTAPRKVEAGTPFHFIQTGRIESKPERADPEKSRPTRPESNVANAKREWQEWGVVDVWDSKVGETPDWTTLQRALDTRPPEPAIPETHTGTLVHDLAQVVRRLLRGDLS